MKLRLSLRGMRVRIPYLERRVLEVVYYLLSRTGRLDKDQTSQLLNGGMYDTEHFNCRNVHMHSAYNGHLMRSKFEDSNSVKSLLILTCVV